MATRKYSSRMHTVRFCSSGGGGLSNPPHSGCRLQGICPIPLTETPLDRELPGHRPLLERDPNGQTPSLDRDPPPDIDPLDRDSNGQTPSLDRAPPDRDPSGQRPPGWRPPRQTPVNKQTGVKHYLAPNFFCGQ